MDNEDCDAVVDNANFESPVSPTEETFCWIWELTLVAPKIASESSG